ncbi:hypothetical protein ebA3307 [Aromatoleum aromaticum EbN1]|uniref:Uncharacterized protein n=1 Tax=Aromatoleum aromaticum (strain DSM 19018 / LMG 30748 / EbN1) TaxID=76114 RepID=Q5P3X4_AROAE|nr:hypothetical protein ebA3307 [Aromatoleum aromaticum EbN1]
MSGVSAIDAVHQQRDRQVGGVEIGVPGWSGAQIPLDERRRYGIDARASVELVLGIVTADVARCRRRQDTVGADDAAGILVAHDQVLAEGIVEVPECIVSLAICLHLGMALACTQLARPRGCHDLRRGSQHAEYNRYSVPRQARRRLQGGDRGCRGTAETDHWAGRREAHRCAHSAE